MDFVRKYNQIRKTFFISQGLVKAEFEMCLDSRAGLQMLNQKRIQIHTEIGELNKRLIAICSECKESCCLGSYDHFSSVDFWMRKYSLNPCSGYGTEIYQPWYAYLFRNRKGLYGLPRNGCPELSREGCRLDVIDRPIRCVAYTCLKFRDAMRRDEKRSYAKLIGKIYLIANMTLRILEKEGAICKAHGYVYRFLTP